MNAQHTAQTSPRRVLAALAAAGSAALLAATWTVPAQAATIWDGDASNGTSVFGNAESECGDGELSVESDDGSYFRFEKSVGTYRCEARGIDVEGERYAFSENSTYWIGWDQNVGFTSEGSEGDWVSWQWKSYPNADQNYPLLMRIDNGRMHLTYVGPGQAWQTIWSAPVEAGQWHRIAIGIHTSSSASDGWVELIVDGERQTFTDGSTRVAGRTWDSANEPKWGAYDRDNIAYEIVNRVRDPRIGTTSADVA